MERSEIAHGPHHPGVPSGAPKSISKPMVHWTQTCTYLASRLALPPNGPSFHLSLVYDEYHRVCPKQFLIGWYISCKLCTYLVPTLTLSTKQKEDRFDMTHVTLGFQRVSPKWYLSIWYVWRKLCTYIASRLALSPNRLRFHLSFVTSEYHRVHTKWFLSSKTFSKRKEVRFHMTHVT
jgi:hypothetical protein